MAEQVLRYPNNLRPSKEGSALVFGSGQGVTMQTGPGPAAAVPTLKGGSVSSQNIMSELEAIYAESEQINREILAQLNKLRRNANGDSTEEAPAPSAERENTGENNAGNSNEQENNAGNSNEQVNNDATNDMSEQEGGKSRRHHRRHTTPRNRGTAHGRHTRKHR